MPLRLSLDTARLGLATRPVQRAHRDFARLASEEGLTLYASRLLADDFDACPLSFQRRYPGLRDWRGVANLKSDVRELAAFAADTPVLLAGRSSQLMRFAARLLFRRSRCVLTADVTWPGYADILERERKRANGTVIRVPLRHGVLWNGFDADFIADRMAAFARQFGCDGLFLPAVTHDGIRLPIELICQRFQAIRDLQFTVVDGAQAFCHTPHDEVSSSVDFYIAGAHKWLRAMHPLGFAFLPHPHHSEFIRDACQEWLQNSDGDDPLLALSESLEHGRLPAFTETVNTLPLFTAQAAVTEALASPSTHAERFAIQMRNSDVVAELCHGAEWHAVRPNKKLQSGILLLQSRVAWNAEPIDLQQHFAEFGIGLTAYPHGWLRLALPTRTFSDAERLQIRRALRTPLAAGINSVCSFWRRSDAPMRDAAMIPAVV